MKYPERSHDLTSLCMHYVLLLRTIAFWGHALILWLLTRQLDQSFPLTSVGLILILLGIFTFMSWLWAKQKTAISDKFVFLQLLMDIFCLTILLYLTGGSSNPFVSLFMLPVTFAAAMLRTLYIWVIAVTAIGCYSLLMYYHQPMMIWQHHGQGFTLHVWGMWCGFLLSAGLVAYFVTRIGNSLRARDLLLAEAREKALESEKMVALGALAAGTAHELGTPLGTIAILSKDLEKAYQEDPRLSRKLGLLRGQVNRCKEILSRMASSVGQSQADSGKRLQLDHWLRQTLEEWLLTRPDVVAESDFSGPRPAPEVIADRAVTQAILNILNNAADASNDLIIVEAHWDQDQLELKVHDKGAGIPAILEDKIGVEPFISTKSAGKGLGLGLYLAKSTLAKLGGDLRLFNRPGINGVTASISLPLKQIMTHE